MLNTTVETKSGSVFDVDMLTMARSLFPPGKTYRFDLTSISTVGTNGTGFLRQAVSCNPPTASCPEWSALASLFDEVRLLSAQLHFIPLVGTDGTLLSSTGSKLSTQPVACAFDYDNSTTAPASYATVIRLARSGQVARTIGDQSGKVTFKAKIPEDRLFARTASSYTPDPPSGCVGAFVIDNANALAVSTTFYHITLRLTVVLRNRA